MKLGSDLVYPICTDFFFFFFFKSSGGWVKNKPRLITLTHTNSVVVHNDCCSTRRCCRGNEGADRVIRYTSTDSLHALRSSLTQIAPHLAQTAPHLAQVARIGSGCSAFGLGCTAYFVYRIFSDVFLEYSSWLDIDLSSSSAFPEIATCAACC